MDSLSHIRESIRYNYAEKLARLFDLPVYLFLSYDETPSKSFVLHFITASR